MRRALGLAIVALALQSCAHTVSDEEIASTTADGSYYGYSMSVENAPPAPDLNWYNRPDIRRISGSTVYIVDEPNYDVFYYDGGYWLSNDGYWYHTHDYRGPFLAVDARTVPREILSVPDRYWRHRDGDRYRRHHHRYDDRVDTDRR